MERGRHQSCMRRSGQPSIGLVAAGRVMAGPSHRTMSRDNPAPPHVLRRQDNLRSCSEALRQEPSIPHNQKHLKTLAFIPNLKYCGSV